MRIKIREIAYDWGKSMLVVLSNPWRLSGPCH